MRKESAPPVRVQRGMDGRIAGGRDRVASVVPTPRSCYKKRPSLSAGDRAMSRQGRWLFTSEAVTMGHPDKMADQISDAVLDAIIKDDPQARVACETLVKTGMVLVSGEITTSTYIEIPEIVRQTVKEIGYDSSGIG